MKRLRRPSTTDSTGYLEQAERCGHNWSNTYRLGLMNQPEMATLAPTSSDAELAQREGGCGPSRSIAVCATLRVLYSSGISAWPRCLPLLTPSLLWQA
ncbi:MAG: hypothetical protein R2857_12175 [Vampirovibrionales bacterium]